MRALKSKHSQTLYGLNPDFPPFLAQICDAEYNLETKAMVYCDFNFVAYPMDLQTCSLRFESKSSGLDLELFDPLDTFHKGKE